MKFAHLADLHLGSWREPKLRELSTKAFCMAMEECIRQQVDFIIFAGDVFDTSLPSFETLKLVTRKLKELQEKNIPVYAIPGSHDFSPTGKTMIDVLEEAGLLKNVAKGEIEERTGEVEEGKGEEKALRSLKLEFTVDHKTGAKITGLPGRKGQLDRFYYEHLQTEHLEQEPGYKIFLFHTTISEMKPAHMEKVESQPVSSLPKNFDYYAGGHIHHPTNITLPGYGTLSYPGALFPNNFKEIEDYSHGGFYIIEDHDNAERGNVEDHDNAERGNVEDHDNAERGNVEDHGDAERGSVKEGSVTWIPVKPIEHHAIRLNCEHKSPEVAAFELREKLEQLEVKNALLTIRLEGQLAGGKSADIPFKEIFQLLYGKGAYHVMKNTAGLSSEGFEEISLQHDPMHLEEDLIKEHLQQHALFSKEKELQLIISLLAAWNTTRRDGEKLNDFQERVLQEGKAVLEQENKQEVGR